jgi:polysaccharide biosynthesis transport protein
MSDLTTERRHHKPSLAAEPTMRDYIEILFRWKYVVIGVLTTVFFGVTFYTLLGDFVYEATAVVQVGTKPTSELAMPSFDLSGLTATRNLMKEISILKSHGIAEEVTRMLKSNPVATRGGTDTLEILEKSEKDPVQTRFASDETIIGRLEGNVAFDPNSSADVIYINARSTNPYEAAIIANDYATAYYENNLQASRRQLRTMREFLEKTFQAKRQSLDAVEDSLRQYIEMHGAVDGVSQATMNLIAGLDARKQETEIDIQTSRSLIESYQKRMNEVQALLPPDIDKSVSEGNKRIIDLVSSFEIQKILEQVGRMETERGNIIELNAGAADQEPVKRRIAEIDRQIDEARRLIRQKTLGESSERRLYDQLEGLKELSNKLLDARLKLQSLEIRLKSINESIAKNEEQYKDVPRKNVEFARLQRSKLALEKVYTAVEEKYQAALVAEQSQFGYLEILQRASPPDSFIAPNIPKNLGFGFFAGLILGISVAFLIHNFDDRIHKPGDVKKLGLSLLAVVPYMDDQLHKVSGHVVSPTGAIDGERGTVNREFLNKEEPAQAITLNPLLVAAINPYSRNADAYRRLRTGIQYWKPDTTVRSILVTSGAPREGKSITSANLAVVFAQSKKKTILVDTDLRRPRIHHLFKMKLNPGLTEVMFSETSLASAIRHTSIENLDVLPCGAIPLNPTELIASPAMVRIKEELESMYDIVIFDSPPLLLFTDGELLVSLVDAVALVAKGNSTLMDDLEHSLDLVEGIKMNFAGVVFNQYVFNRLHRGYYHLHGDYYYQQRYTGPKPKA